MFDRFDATARQVLEHAWAEGADEGCVATEHLLLALATHDPVTADLLAGAGVTAADIRRAMRPVGRRAERRPDQEHLLGTLGVDLTEVRRRAAQNFGPDALARAARRARPRRPHRPLWSYISCSRPLPRPRCDSPLTGRQPAPIPRVKRVLERAARVAGPRPATGCHLLLVLLTGDEPAAEVLTGLGVDIAVLAEAVRMTTASDSSPAG
jgi:ClpA/ClpB-like protein